VKIVVVGGGISGLTAAFHVLERGRETGAPLDVKVVEASERVGGHACTLRDADFLVECGPNGFLDRPSEPAVMDVVRRLGLAPRVIDSRPAARRRFVFDRGRLRLAPTSPPALVASDALSPVGKARLLLEPWARPPVDGADESVFDFARRRLGREVAEVLVDPAVAGVSGGDSRRLSLAAAFPSVLAMEREHGSLLRALLSGRRRRGPRLRSFEGGMQTLIDGLSARLGSALRTGCAAHAIAPTPGGWRVMLADGTWLEAHRLVLALPASQAASLVERLDPPLAGALRAIRFESLAMVALAYDEAATGVLGGYGFLATRAAGLDVLGAVWESSIFDRRAPRGSVLVRAMLGGARRPEAVEGSDGELVARARRDLGSAMGVTAAPLRAWVRRFPLALAQYDVGHLAHVARVRALAAAHPHLHLCGTSYDGVSFASAMTSGAEAARRVTTPSETLLVASRPVMARRRASTAFDLERSVRP